MKYVSINANTIRHNAIAGEALPPIRIARNKSDAKPQYANEIEIIGPARLVYDPTRKLIKCGARMVLECADVKIVRA